MASLTLLAGVLVKTWTLDNWFVSCSAVAVSLTLSMNRFVEVTNHLAGLRAVSNPRLEVGHGLRVRGQPGQIACPY